MTETKSIYTILSSFLLIASATNTTVAHDDTNSLASQRDRLDTDPERWAHVLRAVKQIIPCQDHRTPTCVSELRGAYAVLYNQVPADKVYRCHESVTFATHGDVAFLGELLPLMGRWTGPVSIAVYAPGTDFHVALRAISYLRTCRTRRIRDSVTFHLYYDREHPPIPRYTLADLPSSYNCSAEKAPPYRISRQSLYKQRHKLLYPINVGRNVARGAATTHFVLSADLELYPSSNFVSRFLKFIARNAALARRQGTPHVFVLPVFELTFSTKPPFNKTTLQQLVKRHQAFPFHIWICPLCHKIPDQKRWLSSKETKSIGVASKVKRLGDQKVWEPFYVGTSAEPEFDERLSWEGQSNKMTQAYVMCLLDYDFLVLNNAFLVHKPGIKKKKTQLESYGNLVSQTNYLLQHQVQKELNKLYGRRKGCYL